MTFLGNGENTWKLASPEERNMLARQLFAEAIVEIKTVVADCHDRFILAEATGFDTSIALRQRHLSTFRPYHLTRKPGTMPISRPRNGSPGS